MWSSWLSSNYQPQSVIIASGVMSNDTLQHSLGNISCLEDDKNQCVNIFAAHYLFLYNSLNLRIMPFCLLISSGACVNSYPQTQYELGLGSVLTLTFLTLKELAVSNLESCTAGTACRGSVNPGTDIIKCHH